MWSESCRPSLSSAGNYRCADFALDFRISVCMAASLPLWKQLAEGDAPCFTDVYSPPSLYLGNFGFGLCIGHSGFLFTETCSDVCSRLLYFGISAAGLDEFRFFQEDFCPLREKEAGRTGVQRGKCTKWGIKKYKARNKKTPIKGRRQGQHQGYSCQVLWKKSI